MSDSLIQESIFFGNDLSHTPSHGQLLIKKRQELLKKALEEKHADLIFKRLK